MASVRAYAPYVRNGRQLLPRTRRLTSSRTASSLASTNSSSAPSSLPLAPRQRPFFPIYYNDVYEVKLPPNHRFPMEKYGQVRRLLQQRLADLPVDQRDNVDCELKVSPLATVDELATTHDRDYILRHMTGDQSEKELRNVGFPWSEQAVKRSFSSVGGTVAAACDVCEEWTSRTIRANASKEALIAPWGAHVAGGTHHAFYDRGEGFCIFSDIAVAANVVLQKYPEHFKKILIVDLDVHQGNGNAVLFRDRPEVFTFSIHCQANYFSEKQQSDLDIELPAECTDGTYLVTLNHWLSRLKEEAGPFDLIFFQAGVDVLKEDRLGRMSLTQAGIERRNNLVFEFARDLNVPLVISMGGGYPKGKDWTPIINAHTNVYFQAH